jgi:hypothetical protein
MLLLRFVGVLLLRFGGSKFDVLLLKLPPRITRLEAAPPPLASYRPKAATRRCWGLPSLGARGHGASRRSSLAQMSVRGLVSLADLICSGDM